MTMIELLHTNSYTFYYLEPIGSYPGKKSTNYRQTLSLLAKRKNSKSKQLAPEVVFIKHKKEPHLTLPANTKQVHFIGIGGYGMSALALILLQKGYAVSGSDLKESPLTENLTKQGAVIKLGHQAANLGAADLVVYSTAVPADNPELLAAKQRGLHLWHRSELLAALINNSYGIAIAGAHGKTTTTAMAGLLLEAGGLDPTVIIGGVLPAYDSNARLGSSHYLVAEADESDSSFTRYYPRIALVTGMEPDHLEHYNNDYESLKESYSTFLSHLPPEGTAILCAADSQLCALGSHLSCNQVYYAEAGNTAATSASGCPMPDYYAANIKTAGYSSTFDLYHRGQLVAPGINLGVPGLHNISNAVGTLALAAELGLNLPACATALAAFHGVGRRFEITGTASGITVVDDYAHHPTEVLATLRAARAIATTANKIICLFQPHRYTRTASFIDQFACAFTDADLILLHSVYSAGEAPIPGATAAALAERIRHSSGVKVIQSDNITTLEEQAATTARPGDLIITMGAGDITKSAPRILSRLQN
jgi:UDP-N-acetylmuramate--alanine ligase